ncbi:porin PorA family protein [Nocardia fluminea]|uniref:porin PorA family protein n=1 Tax=Nocardia fluminea TaxID=134984 RepID=UPI00340199BE
MRTRPRRSRIALIGLGVMLVLLASAARFIAAPMLTRLPAGTDSASQYGGTATLLNPTALAAGETTNIFTTDVPVTIDLHVTVTGTEGDIAETNYDVTLNVAGKPGKTDRHIFAIDRVSMEATERPGDSSVESATGVVFTLPLHPRAQNYEIYDTTTRSTVPLIYNGESAVRGRETYSYELAAQGPVRNPRTSEALPNTLPRQAISQLLSKLAEVDRQQLGAALPTLPDLVPIAYTGSTMATLQVDKVIGAPLDSTLHQTVTANVAVGDHLIALFPVIDIEAELTDSSIARLIDTAESKSRSLTAVTIAIPLALLTIGVSLIGVGLVRRRVASSDTATASR